MEQCAELNNTKCVLSYTSIGNPASNRSSLLIEVHPPFTPSLVWLVLICLQSVQSRSASSPIAAPSTVVVPIAAGPGTRWRHQSNSHSVSASSRNPHPIAASSHGTPYGLERAAAALADPSEPHLDMSPLDRVLSAHTHLVRLLAAAS